MSALCGTACGYCGRCTDVWEDDDDPDTYPCFDCNGQGVIEAYRAVTVCIACDGTGRVDV